MGREKALADLHQEVQGELPVAICAAVVGMGGVGKSELARQYVARYGSHYPGGRLWLDAVGAQDPQPRLIERMMLGREMPPNLISLEAQMRYAWTQWQPPTGTLLVLLDDVSDWVALEPLRKTLPARARLIVTSRQDPGRSYRKLALDVLEPPAALHLLAELVGPRVAAQQPAAETLCTRLGYLPLGLELVGRYLAGRPDVSLETMLARLAEKGLDHRALNLLEPGMTAQRGVKAAFEVSWAVLDPEVQRLACILSGLATAPFPWSLVQSFFGDGDAATEEETETLEEWRKALTDLHLLQYRPNDLLPQLSLYELHPLIDEFLSQKRKERAEAEALLDTWANTLVKVCQQIPQSPTLDLLTRLTPTLPHLEHLARELAPRLNEDVFIWPWLGLARFYAGQGLYALAEPWYADRLVVP